MIGFLVLPFPLLLLGFMLFMARVERPLDAQPGQQREIEDFLDDANADELDAFVREGVDSGLRRFRNRVRRVRPSARRRAATVGAGRAGADGPAGDVQGGGTR